MIYLQNITEPQVVFVPKGLDAPEGPIVFRAKSTINLDTEIDMEVEDLQTSDLYYHFEIELPEEITEGEFEYSIVAGDTVVSSGLLVVGELMAPDQYNKEIKYEQYEAE